MKTKNIEPQSVKEDKMAENKLEPQVPQQESKPVRKKKHVSALVAASMGRSAVAQTAAKSFDEAGYPYTGTNDSFHEK